MIPNELWKTIYGIQGQAQQAAENDQPCWEPEKCWDRIAPVLPEPYRSAPDLLAALEEVAEDLQKRRDDKHLGAKNARGRIAHLDDKHAIAEMDRQLAEYSTLITRTKE